MHGECPGHRAVDLPAPCTPLTEYCLAAISFLCIPRWTEGFYLAINSSLNTRYISRYIIWSMAVKVEN